MIPPRPRPTTAPPPSPSRQKLAEAERLILTAEDRELFLRALQITVDVFKEKLQKTERDYHEENERLRQALDERDDDLEDALVRFKQHSLTDDERRDRELERLARQIADIAAPRIEASGAVGAKAVTDLAEKSAKRRELVRDVVVGACMAALVIWQLMSKAEAPPKQEPPRPSSYGLPLPNPANPAGIPNKQ